MACKAKYGLKASYRTTEDALVYAKEAYEKRGTPIRIYYCKPCDSYHLTKETGIVYDGKTHVPKDIDAKYLPKVLKITTRLMSEIIKCANSDKQYFDLLSLERRVINNFAPTIEQIYDETNSQKPKRLINITCSTLHAKK